LQVMAAAPVGAPVESNVAEAPAPLMVPDAAM
jgi:hypothetical protein